MTNCEHAEYDYILTPELMHHGKYVCKACNKFLGWGNRPETIAQEKKNAEAIERLKSAPMTTWEKGFLESVAKETRLSPKQQFTLEKIAGKYP